MFHHPKKKLCSFDRDINKLSHESLPRLYDCELHYFFGGKKVNMCMALSFIDFFLFNFLTVSLLKYVIEIFL